MDSSTFINRNLLALSSKDTDLASRITNVCSSEKLTLLQAKSGHMVPSIIIDGRIQPLHSTVNPEKEGEKIAASYTHSGYAVFFGFGGGYHIRPFLNSRDISHILIIDRDEGMFRTILENIDLRDLILDPRVQFLIGEEIETIERHFLSTYLPAINGDLQTISLSSRLKTEPEYFEAVVMNLRECINAVSDDYTVQSYFGKKWYVNTLANLPAAERATSILRPIKKAIVTGAGPSLELQIDTIRELHTHAFLIATDTSLPSLLQYNISPDAVLSIDCQQVTYMHFISGLPHDIPLILDLASPPDITRMTDNLIFFTSGHPFSQYVNTHWRKFPYIDTSGGNVTHAAISLADSLGAQEINLFGTDFSYPAGKAYARGTYLYPYYRIRENRFQSIEHSLYSFVLRNNTIIKENINGTIRYSTRPLVSYKKRLENSLSKINAKVIQAEGKGLTLTLPPPSRYSMKNPKIPTLFSAGKSSGSSQRFLKQYADAVINVTPPSKAVAQHFLSLPPEERDIWMTMLPAAAAFRRELPQSAITEVSVLRKVHEWTVMMLYHYLHI